MSYVYFAFELEAYAEQNLTIHSGTLIGMLFGIIIWKAVETLWAAAAFTQNNGSVWMLANGPSPFIYLIANYTGADFDSTQPFVYGGWIEVMFFL